MKRFLLFTMLCVSFFIMEAQTIIWTGAGDGTNWSDSNNWDLLHIPTTSNDVIIPDGSTLTINVDADTKSIEIQGFSTLTIEESLSFSNPSSFSEDTVINWAYGGFSGDGTLTNYGTININRPAASFNTPSLNGTTLNNEGNINLLAGTFIIGWNGVLNNLSSGIIDLGEVDIAFGNAILCCGKIYNYGIIRKTQGNGVTEISVETYNYGVIEAMSGVIKFDDHVYNRQFVNNSVIRGVGTVDVSMASNFSNGGTFSPGASVGTLTFIGNFTSLDTSKLEVELEGLNQGVDYDLLAIQGDAIFDGVVDVSMGFEGVINDEFIVATTTGTIVTCNLAPTATSEFDGDTYDFTVACRNSIEVVLTLVNITLGIDSKEFTDKNIVLFPNPVYNDFILRNNSSRNLESVSILDLNGRVIDQISLKGMGKDKIIS